ncbi:putative cold-shock DNA-binding protein [Sphingobacterium allocomposti]|jgi:CspA family cold shock protein|uniref:Putative cold-shock DNA-binding protein n=1 Tax=Sphingobacterium allocomposti TaxID=415956 RepID=A0A5S5DKS9_9SPHI|nr:cold shock domain-containing protein [Sphingobacterium composti Yoo et al. 2007 non Ten et al. 2007]TYP96553.1 putative cold-shock DNA-binding protein [Sphingobacterium composti Yoo et al. 2007 non Ten et al. 2007]HLS96057.1 cold shock domain-containing protein [Sphingobacterium sp.]
MATNQLTFKKKELAKKKLQKKQDKLERRSLKKSNNDKGKTLEEMYAYVDEFGNITTVPPDQREKPTEEEIQRRLNPVSVDEYSFGKVSYYNAQGHYGFIRDNLTKQTVYFNDRLVGKTLQIDQKVKFKFVRSKQGNQVTEVELI